MIILDTNQVLENITLVTPTITLLQALAKATGHRLAIPTVVASEYLAHFNHEVESKVAIANKAMADLLRLAPQWGRSDGDRDLGWTKHNIDSHAARLKDIFLLLPLPEGAADQALEREAYRRLPAATTWEKPGSGARDAAIWLTVLAQLSSEDEVLFTSRDPKAFGETSLHQELRREAENIAPGKLLYFTNVSDILEHLAGQGPSIDDSFIAAEPLVHRAVEASFVQSDQLLFRVAAVRWPFLNKDFVVTGLTDLRAERIVGTRAIQLEGASWVGSEVAWSGQAHFSVQLMKASEGEYEEGYIGVEVPTTVLVQLDGSGKATDAQATITGQVTLTLSRSALMPLGT
jgi:hypothetical protein